MTGTRRRARAIALQALYEIDITNHAADGVIEHLLSEARLPEESNDFVRELVRGVIKNRDKIDENIQGLATAWPIKQLATVDRNILRLAVFEILFDNKVPVKVAINEAVELSKKFGGERTPKFVNGVLGSVSALVSR